VVAMPLRDLDLASPLIATGLRSGRAVALRVWAAPTPLNTSTTSSRALSRLRSRAPAPGPFPAGDVVRRASRAHRHRLPRYNPHRDTRVRWVSGFVLHHLSTICGQMADQMLYAFGRLTVGQ